MNGLIDELREAADPEPQVVIEMGGSNVVLRATEPVDHASTISLADVINVASDSHTTVVIDPDPIRCDDAFASYQPVDFDEPCTLHDRCRPVMVDVAATGVVRVRTERTVWLIDVSDGRFCQVDPDVDIRFLSRDGWTPLVAVCVTPTRSIALGVDGTLTSARRAHQPAAA